MYPILYPNNTHGDASQISEYILNVCKKHRKEHRALVFAFIISDMANPHVNKMLRDPDYIQALHEISGKYITIFFLTDSYVDQTLNSAKKSNSMWLELGVEPVNALPSIRPKELASILIEQELTSSPSILFFQVEDNIVTDYFTTALRENRIEDGFLEVKSIITTAVESLDKVKEENRTNSKELFALLKTGIGSSEFWKGAKRTYDRFIKFRDFIFFWR